LLAGLRLPGVVSFHALIGEVPHKEVVFSYATVSEIENDELLDDKTV